MIARLAPKSLTRDIGVLFAQATASNARAVAVLIVICLIAFLPNSSTFRRSIATKRASRKRRGR